MHENPAQVPNSAVFAERRRRLAGYGLAVAGAVLFSSKGIIIKLAYREDVNAETLLALRMALSLPIFAAVGLVAYRQHRRSGTVPMDRRLVVQAALVGMLGYWIASYTDFLGLQHISAQFARLILFTYPGFVVLFGALFFEQPARRTAVLAFGLSYLGLAIIFTAELGETGSNVTLGGALVLCSAITFALYQLFAKKVIGRMGAGLFTCVAMGSATVPVLLQFALTQPWSGASLSPKVLGYGLLLAIGATVLPSFFMNMALQRISAQANSTIATLSPVVTIVLASAFLGEVFTPLETAGATLVLVGVGWFTLTERKS